MKVSNAINRIHLGQGSIRNGAEPNAVWVSSPPPMASPPSPAGPRRHNGLPPERIQAANNIEFANTLGPATRERGRDTSRRRCASGRIWGSPSMPPALLLHTR